MSDDLVAGTATTDTDEFCDLTWDNLWGLRGEVRRLRAEVAAVTTQLAERDAELESARAGLATMDNLAAWRLDALLFERKEVKAAGERFEKLARELRVVTTQRDEAESELRDVPFLLIALANRYGDGELSVSRKAMTEIAPFTRIVRWDDDTHNEVRFRVSPAAAGVSATPQPAEPTEQ